MDHYKEKDRIEGEQCELYCRKAVSVSSLQKHPISGKPCIRAELSRNATSEISKELQLTEDQKKEKLSVHGIHTDLGDRLVGDAISVFVLQRKPLKFESDEGATHTHGGNITSTGKATLCEIKYAHEHIRNAETKRIESQKMIENKS